MPVPLVDLRAQYLTLEKEIQARLLQVLQNMDLVLGENVEALEQEFAAYCGARYGVGVGSGTDALHLALRALGIRPGDEVITVSHTFVATAEAIVHADARPVFVDIDPVTYTIDPERLESAINHRTRGIIPVHLYGHPANMETVLSIARRRGLWVIEDASQAHGARYWTRPVGSLGDVGCFSFSMAENLGAYGEAGILVTDNEEVANKARLLRAHGSSEKHVHSLFGFNSRLDELQAAILRVKLPHLDEWNDRRRALAAIYTERLSSLPLTTPVEQPWASHVYHQYVVRTAYRDSLLRWLHERGIMAEVHYPIPLHRQTPYRYYARCAGSLPTTERVAQEVLSLPIYPELQPDQMEQVIGAIHEYFAEGVHRLSNGFKRAPTGQRY